MCQTAPGIDAEQTECINPSTGEIIGYSPIHSPEDVARCIEIARKVQPSWQAMAIKDRAKMIAKIQPYMVERVDNLAEAIATNNGKTRTDALATEILPAIASVTYYCKRAKKFLKDRSLMPGSLLLINKKSKLVRIPYGVVGIISPWNYPFAIPFSEVIMALLAGNCVILKTASETQMAGLALKKCIESAGLPKGVFAYVNLTGSKASKAMLDNDINKLFFTGSVGVGKQLAGLAAKP